MIIVYSFALVRILIIFALKAIGEDWLGFLQRLPAQVWPTPGERTKLIIAAIMYTIQNYILSTSIPILGALAIKVRHLSCDISIADIHFLIDLMNVSFTYRMVMKK